MATNDITTTSAEETRAPQSAASRVDRPASSFGAIRDAINATDLAQGVPGVDNNDDEPSRVS